MPESRRTPGCPGGRGERVSHSRMARLEERRGLEGPMREIREGGRERREYLPIGVLCHTSDQTVRSHRQTHCTHAEVSYNTVITGSSGRGARPVWAPLLLRNMRVASLRFLR